MLYVRTFSPNDEGACLALDPSVVTDHVWQMEQKGRPGEMVASFRTVHLPRLVKLSPPWGLEGSLQNRKEGDYLLVAEERGQVQGYLFLRAEPAQRLGWIDHLAVAGPSRRQGVGTSLMEEARRWGRAAGLRALMLALQSRNYPAIRFAQRLEFRFCGYNDHYFPKDVAVFFVSDLA